MEPARVTRTATSPIIGVAIGQPQGAYADLAASVEHEMARHLRSFLVEALTMARSSDAVPEAQG